MGRTEKRVYPLDSSAVIHLASKRKNYTNSFRISVTLSEEVCPSALQKSLNSIMTRFPTIIAGIRHSSFQYEVIPADNPPQVCLDQACLAPMDEDMLQSCAVRVLYKEKKIAVEIFHALTDGYGGFLFIRALVMEYFSHKYGITVRKTGKKCFQVNGAGEDEVRDDFQKYVGTHTVSVNHRRVYQMPENSSEKRPENSVATGIYDVKEVLNLSHSFGVSLTTLLTAVMASSIIEMEKSSRRPESYEPIQIMVPVNLRKKFRSSSVRNFSLYALPCVETCEFRLPFEVLVKTINDQLMRQFSKEHLAGMITTNVKPQMMRLVRSIPLSIKEKILRLCFHYFGERNSCITLSNLGEAELPKELQPFVGRVELTLTPRRNAPCNCGMVSYGGKLYITFSRRSGNAELEQIFFRHLADLGCDGVFE